MFYKVLISGAHNLKNNNDVFYGLRDVFIYNGGTELNELQKESRLEAYAVYYK